MPQVIQRSPIGMLDMLGVNLGDHPKFVEDNIRPIVDLSAFYLESLHQQETDVVAGVTVGGNGAAINVPERELWVVWAISATLHTPSAIGSVLRVLASCRPAPILGPITLATSDRMVTTGAADRNSCGKSWTNGFVCGSGFGFFATVMEAVGGANTATAQLDLLVSRLTV